MYIILEPTLKIMSQNISSHGTISPNRGQYTSEIQHGTWKSSFPIGISFSKGPPFSGEPCLFLGGVFKIKKTTTTYGIIWHHICEVHALSESFKLHSTRPPVLWHPIIFDVKHLGNWKKNSAVWYTHLRLTWNTTWSKFERQIRIQASDKPIHPRRLTWNLRIHPWKKENDLPNHHFQVRFVNSSGV